MDALASFLETAHWLKIKEEAYFCDDGCLQTPLLEFTNKFNLHEHGFQAWKIVRGTQIKERDGIGRRGYIIPVRVISGEPRLLSDPAHPVLEPGIPIAFNKEAFLSPALYLILALPRTL